MSKEAGAAAEPTPAAGGDQFKQTAVADPAGAGKAAEVPAAAVTDDKGGKAAAAAPDAAAAAATAAAAAGSKEGDGTGVAAVAGATGAPEKYSLTLPTNGFLEASDLTALEAEGRKLGLTNEELQAEVDNHADRLARQSSAFLEQTKADKTYGGDNLANTQKLAKRALDKVAPTGSAMGDGLRNALKKSGYENNLHVLGFLAEVGKQWGEDSPASGRQGAAETAFEDVLYPTTAGLKG